MFADGGALRLFDKRPVGRVRLDPDIEALGPDAEGIHAAELREILGRSHAPVKARLLDQHAVAGVGNLLADEALWQAALGPPRPADTWTATRRPRLPANPYRDPAGDQAGGVHTGEIIRHRKAGDHCPRCGAPMRRDTIGGRTTWFCSKEQRVVRVFAP